MSVFSKSTPAAYSTLQSPDPETHWYGGAAETFLTTFIWRSPTWMSQDTFFGNLPPSTKPGARRCPIWSRMRRPVTFQESHATHGFAELEEARGWPMRCMVSYVKKEIDLESGGWIYVGRSWSILLQSNQWNSGPSRNLPMRPVFSGLVVNSLAIGGSLFAVQLMPILIRGIVRTRAGRCFACGYPHGASDVCTECGRPVKR